MTNSEQATKPMTEDNQTTERGTSGISPDDQARLEALERSRRYQRAFKERRQNKEEEIHRQIEEAKIEMEKLRREQDSLKNQRNVLQSLCNYSNTMLDALTAAAAASAAKARSLGGTALGGVISIRGWAEHRWIMLPTVEELVAGSFWTPPDDQISFFIKRTTPEYIYSIHWKFLDRMEQLLKEGKRSSAAQKDVELKISYLISIWIRLIKIGIKERPEMMEEFNRMALKAHRDEAAAGQYIRPLMLRNSPTEVTGFVGLDDEQKEKLEEHWQQFVKDIRAARSVLGLSTSKAADKVETMMVTGQYEPASTAEAAKCFMLTLDAAVASVEFIAQEGHAFTKLWVGAVDVLTPMQTAIVLTSCRPLVPHLPHVCNLLLIGNAENQINSPEVDKQSFYITYFNNLE